MAERGPAPKAAMAVDIREPAEDRSDWSRWTPNQRRVIEDLLGRDSLLRTSAELPSFPDDLGVRLRGLLEESLADIAERYTPRKPLAVRKHDLASVFRCEGFLLAEEAFEWTVPKLRGTAVAKAMSLLTLRRFARLSPLDIAEQVVDNISAGEDGAGQFLAMCSEVDRGELTLACADMLTKFRADWPPIQREWGLRIETPSPVNLLEARILLKAKYDLAVGHPGSNPSDVVIVDFKTGPEYPEHIEEVRHYALLEAIRAGVPPRKIAVHYMDGGYFRPEEVTQDGLLSALRRTVDGVRRIHELWQGQREAVLTPGPTCKYCPALPNCSPGRAWMAKPD